MQKPTNLLSYTNDKPFFVVKNLGNMASHLTCDRLDSLMSNANIEPVTGTVEIEPSDLVYEPGSRSVINAQDFYDMHPAYIIYPAIAS